MSERAGTPEEIAGAIVSAIQGKVFDDARVFVALAGPPAVGKSTIAEHLIDQLPNSALLPMDGYHLDNDMLRERGLLARKGAPETFDLEGLKVTLAALTQGGDVSVPAFDRDNDCVVPGANIISATAQYIVVEGNYLLLDEPGWRELLTNWGFSAFLNADLDTLKTRLVGRWLSYGFSQTDAQAKADENDIPNAERILTHRMQADLVLNTG